MGSRRIIQEENKDSKTPTIIEDNTEKIFYLDFTECDDKNIPRQKNDVKHVIEALKALKTVESIHSKDGHLLSNTGNDKTIKDKFAKYNEKLESIDVYHRNGSNGGKRLIYFHDNTNYSYIKVLSLFIDERL